MVGPPYYQNMLVAALYFWESSTNTFQLPCGMVTPTLFDIAAITGLRPTDDNLEPNGRDEDTINFNTKRASFGKYIKTHQKNNTVEVSDKENFTFLALWLLRCIFCCKLLKVDKIYITLANQLHEGHDICLSQLIL